MNPEPVARIVHDNGLCRNRIFVYGTLKQGFGNWRVHLFDQKVIGKAQIDGIMFHMGYYPAISFEEKFGPIHGEVYDVSDYTLACLDRLEGVPYHYQRQTINLPKWGDAITYTYNHAKVELCSFVIPTGNWEGPQTDKMRWLGLGRGVEIGTPGASETLRSTIVNTKFLLRPGTGAESGKYFMVDRTSGQVIGTYRNISEYLQERAKNPEAKPKISLAPYKPQLPMIITPTKTEIVVASPEPQVPLIGPSRRMA